MPTAVNRTKSDILDTAKELFSRQGYDGTSIRQITSRLEITPAALYYHFTSKQDLLGGLAEPMLEDGDRLLATVRELDHDADGLRIAVEGYYDLLASDVTLFRMVSRDPSIRGVNGIGDRFRDQAREYFAYIVGPSDSVEGQIKAAAAVGTIRRALELPSVDPDRDRPFILETALDILR